MREILHAWASPRKVSAYDGYHHCMAWFWHHHSGSRVGNFIIGGCAGTRDVFSIGFGPRLFVMEVPGRPTGALRHTWVVRSHGRTDLSDVDSNMWRYRASMNCEQTAWQRRSLRLADGGKFIIFPWCCWGLLRSGGLPQSRNLKAAAE